MKLFIRAGICISCLYFMSPAQAGGEIMQSWGLAKETNLYLGGSLGIANQSDFDDGTSGAGKVFGGVRYRSVGAELGYLSLGDADTEGEGRIAPTLRNDTDALYAAAVGYLPVYYRTEVIGKLGVSYWDSKHKEDYSGADEDSGYQDTESNDSGLGGLIGIGAQYHITPNVAVRGEWERLFGMGSDEYETDADLLSVGVSLSTY